MIGAIDFPFQDLVYFWTGSPALPASEEGFQPMPSVTIRYFLPIKLVTMELNYLSRPADDSHLPSANTCISRLYIPLYSRFGPNRNYHLWDCFWPILITQPFSKQILKAKLLMAIKTKNFGFVWLSVHEELSSSEAFPSWIVIVDGLFIGSVIVSLCPPKGKRSCGKTPEISVTSLCQ